MDRPDISMMNPGKKRSCTLVNIMVWKNTNRKGIFFGHSGICLKYLTEMIMKTRIQLIPTCLMKSYLSAYFIVSLKSINNIFTTTTSHIIHVYAKFVRTQFYWLKGFQIHAKPVETFLATLTKSSNIIHVTASQIVAWWTTVKFATTMISLKLTSAARKAEKILSHEESYVSDGENEFDIRFYQWQKGENG